MSRSTKIGEEANMPREQEYEQLRGVLSPELASLPPRQLEAALERYNIDAESMEGWMSALGGIAKVALPIVGGLAGTFVGGPAGAALGSKLGQWAGGAIGGLTGGGAPPAAPAGGATPPIAPQGPMTSFPPGGVAPFNPQTLFGGGAPSGPGSTAAGQLAQTLLRPETMQAMMSMFLGPQLGKSSITVGSTPVPTAAFSNLLGVLANRASAEYAAASAASEGMPRYMRDYAGEAKGDPAVAGDRAEALYELLETTRAEQQRWEASEAAEAAAWRGAEFAESEYDAMDMADIAEFAEFAE
jgi:hypothetical protein